MLVKEKLQQATANKLSVENKPATRQQNPDRLAWILACRDYTEARRA